MKMPLGALIYKSRNFQRRIAAIKTMRSKLHLQEQKFSKTYSLVVCGLLHNHLQEQKFSKTYSRCGYRWSRANLQEQKFSKTYSLERLRCCPCPIYKSRNFQRRIATDSTIRRSHIYKSRNFQRRIAQTIVIISQGNLQEQKFSKTYSPLKRKVQNDNLQEQKFSKTYSQNEKQLHYLQSTRVEIFKDVQPFRWICERCGIYKSRNFQRRIAFDHLRRDKLIYKSRNFQRRIASLVTSRTR